MPTRDDGVPTPRDGGPLGPVGFSDFDLLRSLMELVPDAIYFKDLESRFIRINPVQAATLGVQRVEDAIGTTDADYFDPKHALDAREDEQRIIDTGEPLVGKLEYIRSADGTLRWVSTTKAPLRDREGRTHGTIGITRDTDALVRVQQELRASEARYRGLFSSMRSGAALHEVIRDDNGVVVDYRFLDVNPAFERLTGLQRDGLIGRTALEVLPSLERSWIDRYGHVALTGEPATFEDYSAEFGRWYEVVAFCPERGQFAVIFGDVTDRKRAERTARLNQQRLQASLELSQRAQGDLGELMQFAITAAVEFTESFTGFVGLVAPGGGHVTLQSWIVDGEVNRGDADMRKGLELSNAGLWAEPIRTGQPAIINDPSEATMGGKGTPVWHVPVRRFLGVPVSDGGAVVLVAGVANKAMPYDDDDVQQSLLLMEGLWQVIARRRAEEERARLESQIQQAQKFESLEVLAGGIAHDFNNILMGVLGNASLALMQLPPESPARSSIEHIESAAMRAAELSRQMLAYSGKGRFVIEAIDLTALVREMVHLIQTSLPRSAALRCDLIDDPPLIEADATQMRQVIMNLILNAGDALEGRDGLIVVATSAIEADRQYLDSTYVSENLPEGQYVALEVGDSGVGMTQEALGRVFDPFYTTKGPSRGLGLAAVLGIVRGHRGAIRVYSEPGRGTTFKLLFPVAASPDGLARPRARLLAGNEDEWRGSGTVLIADDEPAVRQVTQAALEMCGFEVLAAEDGERTVELYEEHIDDIVLVLLDMTMPKKNGEQAFREIRAKQRGTPVILSSGFNEQEATNRFAGRGLAGFLQKPYRPTELIAKIREALGQ